MTHRIAPDLFRGQPVRTLIVDDEPLARENLRIRLRDVPDFEIIGECSTGREAITSIAELGPDVVFLDIRMPDLDGISVVEQVPPERMPVVVFVTAYDRFAIEAFRLHALDYLLKPFDEARFTETLQTCRVRLKEIQELERLQEHDTGPLDAHLATYDPRHVAPFLNRIVVKKRGRTCFLSTGMIDWIEACADYVKVHIGEQTWLIRRTMLEMEELLDPQAFARISRFAIINLARVHEMVTIARGERVVRLRGGKELKMTRSNREKLEGRLMDRR